MDSEGQRRRILLVDDDAELRASLRRSLERAQYEVVEASDGHQAFEAFSKQTADVVVMDIQMPFRDGLETILDLVDNYENTRIIAMSGGPTGKPQWLPAAKELGAAVTLQKPFESGQLLEAIEKLLSED